MKNRFLRRGIILLIAGIVLNIIGFELKDRNLEYYSWLMIGGTISFGIGFLLTFYSFFRKVEAQSLLEDRAEQAEKKAQFRRESRKRRHAFH